MARKAPSCTGSVLRTVSCAAWILLLACPPVLPVADSPGRRAVSDSYAGTPDADALVDRTDVVIVLDNSASMAELGLDLAGEFETLRLALVGADARFFVQLSDVSVLGAGRSGCLLGTAPAGSSLPCSPAAVASTAPEGVLESRLDALSGVAASGAESPLLAAAWAACAALDAEGTLALQGTAAGTLCATLPPAMVGGNLGALRADARTIAIVVTDEGEDWIVQGQPVEAMGCAEAPEPCTCRSDLILQALGELGVEIFVFSPSVQELPFFACGAQVVPRGPCNPFGAPVCGVQALQRACETGGRWFPLTTTPDSSPESCALPAGRSIAEALATAITDP